VTPPGWFSGFIDILVVIGIPSILFSLFALFFYSYTKNSEKTRAILTRHSEAFLPFTVPARKVIREKLPTYYA
jgi:hypothetical protein